LLRKAIAPSVMIIPTLLITSTHSSADAYFSPPIARRVASSLALSRIHCLTPSKSPILTLLTISPANIPQQTEKIAQQKMRRGAIPN